MKSFVGIAFIAMALSPVPSVRADEITLIAPGGIRDAIQKMLPEFERRTGHTVKATFGSGGGTKQQVMRGEAFDVPIVQPPLAELLATGHVVPGSETPLATVPVAVAVKKGAAKKIVAKKAVKKATKKAAKKTAKKTARRR